MTWNVGAVMTRDVVTVRPDTSFKSCVRAMRMHGVHALPVMSAGRLVGIVTVADLMLKEFRPTVRERYDRAGDGEVELTAATLMTRSVATVTPDTPLAVAVRLMFERNVDRLPVVDGEGRLHGIVSRSDILRLFLRSDLSIRNEVAKGVLADLPLIGHGRVEPAVRDGVVTLEGEVDAGTLTDVLLRLVASVTGVVGVHNHLKIRPRKDGGRERTLVSARPAASGPPPAPDGSGHRPPPLRARAR